MPNKILCAVAALLCTEASSSPKILNISSWANKRVLIVTAHPDDVEGFSGGLVASLQAMGTVNVSYLVATNGDKGGMCYNSSTPTFDPSLAFHNCESEELAFVRRKEMLSAAEYLGVKGDDVNRLSLQVGPVLRSRYLVSCKSALSNNAGSNKNTVDLTVWLGRHDAELR